MRIGIVNEETWSFLGEIYDELTSHHQTTIFKRRELNLPAFHTRINRYLFHRDMQAFMDAHDVVFFEWASELLLAATHLKKSCPIVTRLHRYEMYKWVDPINWTAVDKIILVSEAKRREFLSRFPEQAPKIVVIREAVSLDKFRPAPKQFNGDIGILCHMTPRKRVYDLILTFAELIQNQTPLHLHIAGGEHVAHAAYYQAMQRLAQELGLQEHVTFYGNVSDPADWYHKIDIFVSNSYSEGLQVAPIEAMASGCYTLCHHWDGAEELLPKDYLFYTNDELKAKLTSYCHLSATEKGTQQTLLRNRVHTCFNIDQSKTQVRKLLESVLAKT
jgi:glycosyltransferase involved in cell wall biosynthesis